ncbi:unnamed protein product [Rotaria magnacalcarata]|uniref:G-protein coupled receptors family 1 profile domain-containing protein n=1 Tax=Rotaria magnacalcarata TaxID=392030 RepID=A0A819HUP1_9BILA|nr:unnamed protein product [Rotaria magnacalcarata]CAF3794952.1 unnamed protein product [Rotaria magnacalcarata]CAF3811880.1 unnamed protein product [Rotaria magnacalcarata]CAF3907910.1 unnamed protein product [Rotaria magnacalcarata]
MTDSDTILPRIPNINILTTNHSTPLEFLFWNQTDITNIIRTHHPILYVISVYALLLIIVGTIGNILTIIILFRPSLRQHTTMRYLIAVATADLCSLYSWNLNLFYKHLINPNQNDLEDLSVISCRCLSFLAFVSLELSSWFLTLVSVDRCLSIYFLFWHRKWGRAKYANYIILTLTATIILTNSHLLFLNGYKQLNCIPHGKRTCIICYSNLHDPYYIFPKWEKIHVIVYNIIPFSIMCISNSFIIRRAVASIVNIKKNANQSHRQHKQKQLTYLLLFVTFLFVLLTTPVMIYNVFLRNYLAKKKLLKYILHGTLLCMQFTSHAVS